MDEEKKILSFEEAKEDERNTMVSLCVKIKEIIPDGWEISGKKGSGYKYAVRIKGAGRIGWDESDNIGNLKEYTQTKIKRMIDEHNEKMIEEARKELFYEQFPIIEEGEDGNQDGKEVQNEEEELEREIEEIEEALKTATKLNIEKQVQIYSDKLELAGKVKKVIEQGYSEVFFEEGYMDRFALQDYPLKIPLEALKELSRAVSFRIYDSFQVWKKRVDYDPVLVGLVSVENLRYTFKIVEW